MKECKSGRVITRKQNGKEVYFLRLNLVDTGICNGKKKYSTLDIETGLVIGKRNYQKAAALLDTAITSYTDEDQQEQLFFHDYCKNWLEHKQTSLETTTYEGYEYRLRLVIDYFAPRKVLLDKLTPVNINDFYHYLLVVEHGKGKRRKVGYSNRSIKDIATLVKEILNEAVLLQYISENPAEKIKVPHKIENIEQKAYIGADEVAVFLAAIKGHRLEIPFIFGLYYGLRREEIVGLRWSALHDDGKLYIEHTVSRVKTTVAKDRVKTEASYRYYPVSTPLLKKLEKLRKEQIMNQARLGAEYIVSDYIFTWEDGRRYSPDYLTKSFKKVVRSNPLLDDSLTLHSLRASCVSILIHGGTDIKDVQEWVGHKDIQTTLNIYARTNEKQKNKVNQKMLSTMFEAV